MFTQTTKITDISCENYQLIEGEKLQGVVITSQILAGSRVHKARYSQVVFSDCTFYACDFQGVIFDNCVFENCSFEFSHLRACQFKNCNFTDCNWKASSSIKSHYEHCDLGLTFKRLLTSGDNVIKQGRTDYTTDIYIELALVA